MNKIWIIIQREYSVRIKKRSFILLTILMPFLIAAVVFVPAWLAMSEEKESCQVSVIDVTGRYGTVLENTDCITFATVAPTDTLDQQLESLLSLSDNAVVLTLRDSLGKAGAVTLYSPSEVPGYVEKYINEKLSKRLRNDRLSAYQIEDIEKLVDDVNADLAITTIKWDKEKGATVSSAEIAGVVGLLLSLLIYMFILSYGSMVMQGVMEEKTNRIVEIMVSSVKSYQLMFGKIIAVALVGLTQFFIWALMLVSLFSILGVSLGLSEVPAADGLTPGMTAEMPESNLFLQVLQGMNFTEMGLLFVCYFVGGYLLYASIFAAIGASVNEQQDSQQFMLPIVLLFTFALYAGMFSRENPDGPLALWCSFIPFTSPVVMMVRLPFSIPWWQTALSLVLLYGTSAAIIWLSSRIYRVGILMYGKKPTLKDMMKWVRYK